MADSIFGKKSGPALAGPAGPATTALFGENFCLLEGRKNIFLSASRSQFVLTRPAKKLEIVQQIKFLCPK